MSQPTSAELWEFRKQFWIVMENLGAAEEIISEAYMMRNPHGQGKIIMPEALRNAVIGGVHGKRICKRVFRYMSRARSGVARMEKIFRRIDRKYRFFRNMAEKYAIAYKDMQLVGGFYLNLCQGEPTKSYLDDRREFFNPPTPGRMLPRFRVLPGGKS